MVSATMNTDQDEAPATLLDAARLHEVEEAYRDLTMVAFPFETKIANTLAYLRTSAAPRIANLVAHTGHAEHAPLKRATDTGLLMYELFYNGFDSPQGRAVVGKLRQMHHRWSIRDEDYVYVLGTFAVLGPQTIDRYGWRKLDDHERQVTVDFFRELGTRMGMVDIPETYDDFEDAFETYERTELRRTDNGQRLMEVGWDAAATNLPAPLRPLARSVVAALTDEPARTAMGLKAPTRAAQAAVRAAMLTRGIVGRVKDPESGTSSFTPGGAYEVYPDGYTIDDLGVGDHARHPDAGTHLG